MSGARNPRAMLALVLATIAILATAAVAQACTVPANAAALRAELAAAVNAQRRQAGLAVLPVSPVLERVAQELACDNARRNMMSHSDAAGRNLATRLRAQGYRARAANENIATRTDVAGAIRSWLGSRQHRSNMLDRRTRELGTGVAYTRTGQPYWVFVSAQPR